MITKFFEIIKQFFDLMHSPFIEDVFENDVIIENFDYEQGLQEISYGEEFDEKLFDCNLCYATRRILLFINHGIYNAKTDKIE